MTCTVCPVGQDPFDGGLLFGRADDAPAAGQEPADSGPFGFLFNLKQNPSAFGGVLADWTNIRKHIACNFKAGKCWRSADIYNEILAGVPYPNHTVPAYRPIRPLPLDKGHQEIDKHIKTYLNDAPARWLLALLTIEGPRPGLSSAAGYQGERLLAAAICLVTGNFNFQQRGYRSGVVQQIHGLRVLTEKYGDNERKQEIPPETAKKRHQRLWDDILHWTVVAIQHNGLFQ